MPWVSFQSFQLRALTYPWRSATQCNCQSSTLRAWDFAGHAAGPEKKTTEGRGWCLTQFAPWMQLCNIKDWWQSLDFLFEENVEKVLLRKRPLQKPYQACWCQCSVGYMAHGIMFYYIILSYQIILYHMKSYYIKSNISSISYHITSYRILSYLILLYHILS